MRNRQNYSKRYYFVLALLVLCFLALIYRMVDLSVINRPFLQRQSNLRSIRVVATPAHRGMITDRSGVPLAVSTVVDSVWVNPQVLAASDDELRKIAAILEIPYNILIRKTNKKTGRWFVYLKRHIRPEIAEKLKDVGVYGLFLQQEYRRYYPEGEVMAHVLGFTNIDDKGQEGLELAFDNWLRGVPGKKKIIQDRLGHLVADLNTISKPQRGNELNLSLDYRIQYLAYYELKRTVQKYHAESGSVVVLDVKTGEILAMVNQPSYNPNDPAKRVPGRYRNRAVTDLFEPGSTMKAFSITSILESNKYKPTTKINTSPGWMVVDGNTIRDENVDHGVLTVTGVLQKSSNVGVARMLFSLPYNNLWNLLHRLGFGERTVSGFPGEAPGSLNNHRVWKPFVLATLGYGYGVSVTALQLACAYAVIAADGVRHPTTFLRVQDNSAEGERVISSKVAKQMLEMLESVAELGGTGIRAQIPGYTVAGKTGTAYIAGKHGYDQHDYIASFVGIAPASNPRLVAAVIIRKPHGQHFGGLVAAPAFARIMHGALRFLDVSPDNIK